MPASRMSLKLSFLYNILVPKNLKIIKAVYNSNETAFEIGNDFVPNGD